METREALEKIRSTLMDEMDMASTERDDARVDEVQQGRVALSVLENVLRSAR